MLDKIKRFLNNIINKIINLTGADGLLHIVITYAIVVTIGYVDLLTGLWVALAFDIIKELFDRLNGATWSEIRKDYFCDLAGLALGGLVVNILYLL